jgi:hypothetical protein
MLPDAAAALYRFDPGSDQLVLEAAAGRLADVVPTTVRLGAGVTGWVGVNRVAMANSDAALDLGDAALDVWPPLHLSVSAPIVQKNVLHGVLTVYSSFAFSEPDRFLVEVMAEELGPLLARSAQRQGLLTALADACEYPAAVGE